MLDTELQAMRYGAARSRRSSRRDHGWPVRHRRSGRETFVLGTARRLERLSHVCSDGLYARSAGGKTSDRIRSLELFAARADHTRARSGTLAGVAIDAARPAVRVDCKSMRWKTHLQRRTR